MNIKKSWIPNEEGVAYELTINETTYKAIETAGTPMALYDAIALDDAALDLIDGIEFIYDDEFEAAWDDINDNECLTKTVDLDDITSDGIRGYFKAILMTLVKK